jgi:hypothetical protein
MTTTSSPSTKLSPHTVWLFALGAVAAGIAITYFLPNLGQKVNAAIYFAIVAVGGFASTYLTRAKIGSAVVAFLLTAVVAAIGYYLLVKGLVSGATTTMTDTLSPTAEARTQGAQAANQMGSVFGIFVAVIVFLETAVAGIGGAIAGGKARGQGGLAALGTMAKSAR